MFELGLGVILAALFVVVYLLASSFLRKDKQKLGGNHPAVTLNPIDTTHAIGAGKSKRALTSGEKNTQFRQGNEASSKS